MFFKANIFRNKFVINKSSFKDNRSCIYQASMDRTNIQGHFMSASYFTIKFNFLDKINY